MKRVKVKDLALVAFASGLLAFELASLGEALPNVKQALADHGLAGRVNVASACATGATTSAPGPAGWIASPAAVGAVKGHAHKRIALVTVKRDASCAFGSMVQSVEKLREVEKAVDLALKHATL